MHSAGKDDDQPPPMSINAEGSGQAQMPIQGYGSQTNIFGEVEDRDISVVIQHEHSEITIRPSGTRFSVEITNIGRDRRRLELHVKGLPVGVSEIDKREISIGPNDTVEAEVILRCTETKPGAGNRTMSIVAVDDDRHTSWESWPRTVVIPPVPNAKLRFDPPEERISAGGYRARATVENAGNTRLSGSLQARDLPQPGEPPLDVRVVGGGHFELGPGQGAGFDVDLVFPAQPWFGREWCVAVRVDVDRNDMDSVVHQSTIRQHGLLSELPQLLAGRSMQIQRGTVLTAFAAVLAVITAIGLLLIPSGPETPPAPQHPAAGSGSETSPITVPPGGPITDADIYTHKMECPAGKWLLFLGTQSGNQADIEARLVFAHETARLVWAAKQQGEYPASLRFTVHASLGNETCELKDGYVAELVSGRVDKDKLSRRRFVWLWPPVASKEEGRAVCEALGKPWDNDCHPHEIA